MSKAIGLGLALITAAFITRGYVTQADALTHIQRCADHHPWEQVREREPLIWCIAHAFDSPGSPRYAIQVAHCESGTDLQDTYAGDGLVGTFQHLTRYWHDRWETFGSGTKSSPTNVLSQAVVSVRMARASGWGAWSCA